MAEYEDSERTEEATPQRREDFRKKGQVAQSREIGSVFALLASLLVLWLLGRFFLDQLSQVFTRSLTDFAVTGAKSGDWTVALKFAVIKSALVVGPLAGILWIVNVMSTVVQVGLLYNEEALQFDFKRLNPVDGMKKIISMKALIEGFKAVLKVAVVTTIVYFVLRSELDDLPHLYNYQVQTLFHFIAVLMGKLIGSIAVFMLVLATLDYFFQRWEIEKKMRMTKQELKEEIKSREGDPLIRARVRKLQREMAQKRMMNDVPKADVIITNPTHIAIALQYGKEMVAPKMVAKGAGEIAERIKKLAREHNVPIVENKPLARTMFKTMKIGQIIPRELYTAVAEVLSYIFRLKKKRTS